MTAQELTEITDSAWEDTDGFETTQTTLDIATSLKANSDTENGNDAYTKLLIHSDTNDSSTTFTDSSASAHSITQYDTAQHVRKSVFGTSSIYFD